MYDRILKNGRIMDGTGKPSYEGDIAIRDGRIEEVAPSIHEAAHEVVNLHGLAVAPGFIDNHSHSDTVFLEDDRCEGKLLQGVTSEVSGQCGSTIYPCPLDGMERLMEYADAYAPFASSSLREFTEKLQKNGIQMGTNQIPLIGHGALRVGVMGYENRPATEEELSLMARLLREQMEYGAWGMSLGLGYTPGISSNQTELDTLGAVVAEYGGVVHSHMRYQNERTPEALEEMFHIARASGVRVNISHFKAGGKSAFGMAPYFAELVHRAQREGIRVSADVYPYTASSSGITNSFPKWSIQGGISHAVAAVQGERRQEILDFLAERFSTKEEGEGYIIVNTAGTFPQADGCTLWEVSQKMGLSMAETMAELTVRSNGKAWCIGFGMSEEDVAVMLAQNDFAIGSDGSAFPFDEKKSGGKQHPRNYATFPRFLRLVREQEFCTMEQAVARITRRPCEINDIRDRGLLQEGKIADITVFDPDTITDCNTFKNPCIKPKGVLHVLMEGQFAVRDGEQTDQRLGKILRKPQK